MSGKAVNVMIYLSVHDPKAFAAAARAQAEREGLEGVDLRVYNHKNLGDCARMLFDPGQAPPGCSILDSSADEEGLLP